MSHYIEMLSFDINEKRDRIQSICDEWGNNNCDPRERGGRFGGLGSNVQFTDRTFDCYDDAVEYLYTTTGNYRQLAVKYKSYPKTNGTKTIQDLERRITEYNERIISLNKPHYMGVKQATVKCKSCGSSLATSFCGKSYRNTCPVCRTDLRPQSVMDKIVQYESTVKELEKKLKTETKKQNVKMEKKAKLHWLVCCEVHC